MGLNDFLKKAGLVVDNSPPKEENTSSNNLSFTQEKQVPAFKSNTDDIELFHQVAEAEKTVENFVSYSEALNPFVEKLRSVYKEGFIKLNKPDFDFFEFYQGCKSNGFDNIAAYPMAFNMAKSMNPYITKEMLVQQADQYVKSIEGYRDELQQKGATQLAGFKQSKTNESKSLQETVERLKTELKLAQEQLDSVESKYSTSITECTNKKEANIIASKELIDSINLVKENIKNNIN
jgi:hypothetical protein